MRLFNSWLERGFLLHHTPGIARAWLRIEPRGDWYFVTDPGGYDLPSKNGPFVVTHVSRGADHDDDPTLLADRAALAAWLRPRVSCPIPTDPRL